jgi:hypothetical protein
MGCDRANASMRLGRFLFGFFAIWGALYASGAAQGGSVAYGLPALAITVAVAALWEHFVFATPARALLGSLGFGRPLADRRCGRRPPCSPFTRPTCSSAAPI